LDSKENNSTRVFIEDGRHFIERQPSNQYDMIVIDAFTVNGHIQWWASREILGVPIKLLPMITNSFRLTLC
jgi:spermidine synthase